MTGNGDSNRSSPSPYLRNYDDNDDTQKRAPPEIIPLDFTPIHLPYPTDWKNMFATKGFMLAMHVPSFLAKDKSKLTRSLYSIGTSNVDVKQEWKFLNDLKNIITASKQLEGFTDPNKNKKRKGTKTRIHH